MTPLTAEEEATFRSRIDRLRKAGLPLGRGDIIDARFLATLDAARAGASTHVRYELWDGEFLCVQVDMHDPGDIGEPRDAYADGVTYLSVRGVVPADDPIS